jgi:hypothetical protein
VNTSPVLLIDISERVYEFETATRDDLARSFIGNECSDELKGFACNVQSY